MLIQINDSETEKTVKTTINHYKKEISMQFIINNVNLNLYDD